MDAPEGGRLGPQKSAPRRTYPLPKPYGEYLLVRPFFEDDDQRVSTLWLPPARRKALPVAGVVLATGRDVRGISAGQVILWTNDSASVVRESLQRIDESLFFVHQAIIVAIVEDESDPS